MNYKTIKKQCEGVYKDKGSKFICILFPLLDEETFVKKLQEIKAEHKNARHWCYSYRLGHEGIIYRINDDGEPSGTAGKPIHNQLLSNSLTNVAAIVVRYFGGTKLGTSGLIKAYKSATSEAINSAVIEEKEVSNYFEITFDYAQMPAVMKWVRQNNLKTTNQNFDLDCSITVVTPVIIGSIFLNTLPLKVNFELIKCA